MTHDPIDTILQDLARLPEPQFWRILDNPSSAFWRAAHAGDLRELVVQLYWYRKQFGLWRKPSSKLSAARFLFAAIAMIDDHQGGLDDDDRSDATTG